MFFLEERLLHQNSFIRCNKLHSWAVLNFLEFLVSFVLMRSLSIRKCNNISPNLCKAIEFVLVKAFLHHCDVIISALPIT